MEHPDICDIKISDASVETKASFKALCRKEHKTYRDMLQDMIDFYNRNNVAKPTRKGGIIL